jgi:hypothetical protein
LTHIDLSVSLIYIFNHRIASIETLRISFDVVGRRFGVHAFFLARNRKFDISTISPWLTVNNTRTERPVLPP